MHRRVTSGDVLSVTAVGYPRSFGIKLCISVTDKHKKHARHYGCGLSAKEEEKDSNSIVVVSAASLATFHALQLWKTLSYRQSAFS